MRNPLLLALSFACLLLSYVPGLPAQSPAPPAPANQAAAGTPSLPPGQAAPGEITIPKTTLKAVSCESLGISAANFQGYSAQTAPVRGVHSARTTLSFPTLPRNDIIVELNWSAAFLWDRPRASTYNTSGQLTAFQTAIRPIVIPIDHGEAYKLHSFQVTRLVCHQMLADACPACPLCEEEENAEDSTLEEEAPTLELPSAPKAPAARRPASNAAPTPSIPLEVEKDTGPAANLIQDILKEDEGWTE